MLTPWRDQTDRGQTDRSVQLSLAVWGLAEKKATHRRRRDPTNTNPWYDADIKVLCRAAADARKLILAGKKVAFLCKAGLNRSPTLARMASHGMNVVGVAMPVDEALCELALCDLEDPSALAKLTPVGVRKQRKRSRPDA